jgi:sulfite dehydrogenase (cytochrome) subunit B
MRATILLALATLASTPAFAEERTVTLKRAPGVETVEANCNSCHSLDYIQMNAPFLPPAKWDGEVNKMIRVFGAPIVETDAKTIAEYLKANYGG